jgi:hypothetical protein
MAVDTPAPSSRPTPIPAAQVPDAGGSLARARPWVQARALFVVGVCAVVMLSLAGIPSHLGQDGWLALVAGRVIAATGIPHHDYLTVMAHGARWIDQQWLAQLIMYALQQLGGLQLLTVVYVLITGAAFGGAVAAARRLGAQDLHVLMVLPAGAFFYLVTAVSIRTQGFAYPLFVLTLWLLAAEFPRPGRSGPTPAWRVYMVFPILILWANLHGSVTLGVGITMIFGVTLLIQGVGRSRWRGLLSTRAWLFVVAPPLTLFATPYGTSIVHYYSATLLNSEFGKLVTEWQPVTGYTILAVPLFLLIVVTAVLLFRSRRRTPLFDCLVLAVLACAAVDAVRNITWFGLAVLILLPAVISRCKGDRPAPLRRARVNYLFAVSMLAFTVIAVVLTGSQSTAWFVSTYPSRAVADVRHLIARDPSAKVFADVRYADWLIWDDPALAGRIAYDTSLELLTIPQLKAIAALDTSPSRGNERILAPYGIWLLYPRDRRADRFLLAGPGVTTLVHNSKVVIATQHVATPPPGLS